MGSGRKNKKYDSQAKITSEPSRKNPWDIENSHPKKNYQQYRAEEHSSLKEIQEYNKWWLQFSRGVQ